MYILKIYFILNYNFKSPFERYFVQFNKEKQKIHNVQIAIKKNEFGFCPLQKKINTKAKQSDDTYQHNMKFLKQMV
jgi:hypothetical protein